MEYQHAAVDQYARTITPDIPEFVGYNSGENSTVSLEYAQAAFRFGHSTMRETIDYLDPDGGITGKVMSLALEQAFLNPQLYADTGAAAIAMGLTHQQMNEIDELLTPAMNQGLLGQPLDLAAINIARGRDVGLPTLNDFREAVGLTRYSSWADFGNHMVHPESLVNFIAAYSFDGDVARAQAIIGLEVRRDRRGLRAEALGYTLDQAIDFLNGGDEGYNRIDTWIGGIAEVHVMGGLLGETFNVVFVDQIQRLMDGDRFYYLYPAQQPATWATRSPTPSSRTSSSATPASSISTAAIFAYADQYYRPFGDGRYGATPPTRQLQERPQVRRRARIAPDTLGVFTTGGNGTAGNGSIVTIGGVQYIRDVRADGRRRQLRTSTARTSTARRTPVPTPTRC